MTNQLISLFSLVAVGLLTATACNNDVDTPPWLPNYADSGYGGAGAGGKPSAGASGKPEAAGAAGEGGDTAASAGAAGAP